MDLRKVSTTFLKWWTSVTKVEDDLDFWGIPQNPYNLTVSRGPELVWGSQTRSSDATWYGFLMKPKPGILDKRGVIPMANRWRWRDVHTNSNSKVFTLIFSTGRISGESLLLYPRWDTHLGYSRRDSHIIHYRGKIRAKTLLNFSVWVSFKKVLSRGEGSQITGGHAQTSLKFFDGIETPQRLFVGSFCPAWCFLSIPGLLFFKLKKMSTRDDPARLEQKANNCDKT